MRKTLKNIPAATTDLSELRECRLEEFRIGPVARIKINQLPESETFSPLAVAGTVFSCIAAIRSRLPVKALCIKINGTLAGKVFPVKMVIFPEEATLLPDVVSDDETVDIAGNSTAIFLLVFDLPENIAPGKHKLTLTAKSASHHSRQKSFFIKVLPPVSAKTLKTPLVNFWPHWETFCQHYHIELWSEAFWQMAEHYLREMAAGGMNVIMASINYDPFLYPLPPCYHQYNYYPGMVVWQKDAKGKWSFQYTNYDRYVTLNMQLGINREIECHAMLPCKTQLPEIVYLDLSSGELVRITTRSDADEYLEAWSAFLTDFIAHNRTKGWEGLLTVCPYDEPSDPVSFRRAARLVRQIAPEIRITAAITAATALELIDCIDIATVHLSASYDEAGIIKLRDAGVEVRWYNCCNPDWGNTLFCCELSDSYRISWMTAAGGFNGFLRWSIIDWPEMVFENPGFNWPTGDTHLLYPGRNGPLESLRWHAYKQGQQDLRVFMSLPPGIERDALLTELGVCRPVKWRECPGMLQQRLYHLIESYQHAGQL